MQNPYRNLTSNLTYAIMDTMTTTNKKPSRISKKMPSSVRLTDDMKQYVEKLADIHGTSVSKIIIAHIKEGMDNNITLTKI